MKSPLFTPILAALCTAALMACSSVKDSAQLTQPLAATAWSASKWLSAKDAPVITGVVHDGARSADGASWFGGRVTNAKRVVAARWMTVGLGTYDLYVNGREVGKEVLKPGFTHPLKTKRAYTYDVTKLLDTKAGATNTLAAQVTPGWWGDKIVTPAGNQGMWGTKCAFRGVLELTYADGSTERFGTDPATWRGGIAGQVQHAGIFDGEVYDARQTPGLERVMQLAEPEVNTEFRGQILPTNGAEIYLRRDLAISPQRAYVWQGTEGATDNAFGKVVIQTEFQPGQAMTLQPGQTLVVDFGQNCAAVPEFVFHAAGGTQLTCAVGELLNDGNGAKSRGMDGPEGSVHRLNLRTPQTGMWLSYTFADTPRAVTYRPTHTFFGYRFVSVTATAPVQITSLRSIPVTSIAREMETGQISTGNELVNRLIANTYWGQLSNYLSVPTDCPQRNERLGWTADTQVFTATGTFFADTRRFFHKWMHDMIDSQGEEGGFPGVAPLAQYGGEKMRVGWADAGVIVPWTIWKQFGDTAIVNQCWDAMVRYIRHVSDTRYDHQSLLRENGNYQWADWLSYEPLESCSGKAFDQGKLRPEALDYWNYLCASYWLLDAGMMLDMAQATGRDARPYVAMAAQARAYIRDRFLTPQGTFRTDILNTMQTPALFALHNRILDGKARQDMIERLRQNFHDHGDCLQTGFLGTSILMPTLTACGLNDLAYTLLLQRKNPSWLYSIDQGATTIWERWNSYTIDQGMGPRGMNSFNHYAYGCVCQWLWETAAGIAADPSQPGFRHILMRSVPDRRLGHLRAEYRSAAGLIKSAWRYDGDRWTWTFTIPQGATATVTLPWPDPEAKQPQTRDYPAGTYTIKLKTK